MQNFGLVSIITPTWACADFIAEAIKSIQAQTYQNSGDVITRKECFEMSEGTMDCFSFDHG